MDEPLFREALYVTHAGYERIPPGNRDYPPAECPNLYKFEWNEGRIMPDFCLALVAEGHGSVEIRNCQQPIQGGQAFFYHPGQWHRHRPSEKSGWTILWIFFNGDLPLQWLRSNAFRLSNSFPIVEDFAFFEAQFERVVDAAYQCRTKNSTVLSWQSAGLISHFLLDKRTAMSEKSPPHDDDVVRKTIEYIWNFSHNNLNVSAVVEASGINRRTLERRFKNVVGRGILAEIQHCRLMRAARLLDETEMPIKHIVERSGFLSRECMRIAFLKEFGQPPEKYRKARS